MTYRKRLLLIFSALFFLYATIIIILQIQKDKEYQTICQKDILRTYGAVVQKMATDSLPIAEILTFLPTNVRLSFIDSKGILLYDNVAEDLRADHSERPEINIAKLQGEGFSIRKSTTTQQEYLYYAFTQPNGNYIRLALPYVILWNQFIHFDTIIIYVIMFLFFVVLLLLIFRTEKFDYIMKSLTDFATKAENGHVDYSQMTFPDTPFGKVSAKIISLYKQLEESKLQTSQEKEKRNLMKKEMTNNIAHELKTPVSSIRGYLEILVNNKNIDTEKRQYFLEHSYAQTLRLSDLIQDISLITKLEESSSLFPKEKIDLHTIFNEASAEWQELFTQNNIVIENRLDSNLFMAGNHNLIYSIFRNLIENAIKYAGENIKIVIECTQHNSHTYHLRFYDTGIGVKNNYLERIFERFVRIDDGRSRKNGGTGLGLSIVKHAVQFHGGTITASNRENGGLQFDFTLSS